MATVRTDGHPTLRIGVIGIGGAAVGMLPAFLEHPHMKITAAADINAEILERFTHDYPVEAYRSAEELCKSPNVDAVYIATPNQFHTEHTLAAVGHKKHVLVEKPMALTLKEADLQIKSAKDAGVHLGVNVKHSFEPRIRRLREIVRSGELGRLRMINYWHFSSWLYSARTAEELNPNLGGGVPWRQGPHQFDIIRTLAGGMVRSVRSMTGVWDPTRPVVGAHAAFIEFEDGVAATAIYSGYDHFSTADLMPGRLRGEVLKDPMSYGKARREIKAIASQAAELELKQARRYGGARTMGVAEHQRQRGPQSGSWEMGGPMVVSFEHGDVRLSPRGLLVYDDEGAREIEVDSTYDGTFGITRAFYDAVVHDRPPAADGPWGKATLEVILAVLESARQRKEIHLAHQRPTTDVDSRVLSGVAG